MPGIEDKRDLESISIMRNFQCQDMAHGKQFSIVSKKVLPLLSNLVIDSLSLSNFNLFAVKTRFVNLFPI